MFKKILIILFLQAMIRFFIVLPPLWAQGTVNICIDENFWGPFTFVLFDKPEGIHIELAKQALNRLGFRVKFNAYPWKRCLAMNKTGECDGVLSLSYKPDRTQFLYYPKDAGQVMKSRWRVTMAEYVIVTHVSNPYEWNGDDATLPEPVRLPLGYGTVDRLKAKNIDVQTSLGDKNIFAMLLRDKIGVAIAFRLSAESILRQKKYAHNLKILPRPYATKSYYFGISKKGQIDKNTAERIWEAIAEIRDNPETMDPIIDKVNIQIESCKDDKVQCGLKMVLP